MKTTFTHLMTQAGATADNAESTWTTFVATVCKGREPTPVSLKFLSDEKLAVLDDPIAEGVLQAIRDGKTDTVLAAPPPPKVRKFKADKARAYTHVELVAFLALESTLSPDEQAALRAEIQRWTGGAPFRFLVSGKLATAETADRILALYKREPVAPFVVIDGREVEPVGFDVEPNKTFPEDPFERGNALGQPGDVSRRLGVSIADVLYPARQAIAVAMEHDLADAPTVVLLGVAKAAAGKTAEEVLASYPKAARAWQKMPEAARPALRVEAAKPVPFVAPPGEPRAAVGGKVPHIHVMVGGQRHVDKWKLLQSNLRSAERAGLFTLSDDWTYTSGHAALLRQAALERADVVVCLVSVANAAADEVEEAMVYCARTGRRFVPVTVGVFALDFAPFAHLHMLPPVNVVDDKRRVNAMTGDEMTASVAQKLMEVARAAAQRGHVGH